MPRDPNPNSTPSARQQEEDRQPPDLQKLVEAFGGYRNITPEAWAQWDAENKLYDERMRSGCFYRKTGKD
jgi:hypothetical protein